MKPISTLIPPQYMPETVTESETRLCIDCGAPEPEGVFKALDYRCPPCCARVAFERVTANRVRNQRDVEQRMAIVPDAFMLTEESRLPNPTAFHEAMRWQFGPKGLVLYGPKRTGKSRAAWEIVKREIRNGRSVRAVGAFELFQYPSLWSKGGDAPAKFAREMVDAELLLLDDVFKAKQSERIEELMFAVLEERSVWSRPCVVTLNDVPDTLEARMSADRGPAIIGRLKDYCGRVNFA